MVDFLPRNHQIPIDGALMKEKARFFTEKLKYLGFKASDGWMEKTARKTQHYFFIKTFIDTFLTALIFSLFICCYNIPTIMYRQKPPKLIGQNLS